MTFSGNDIDVLARTLYGEARGEPFLGKLAVAWVIRNRASIDLGKDGKPDWWGEGVAGVCLAPKQFSCWLPGDPNLPQLQQVGLSNMAFQDCLAAAAAALAGIGGDPSHGATHYYAIATLAPDWARGRMTVARIGGHAFYRLV